MEFSTHHTEFHNFNEGRSIKMREFKIPYDISHEEKILGGYLSLRQIGYCAIAATSLAIFFTHIHIFIKILFVLLVLAFTMSCSFIKINGLYFDKHLKYYLKFKKRNKCLLYKR